MSRRRRPKLTRDLLKRVNVAWNRPDPDPLETILHSTEFAAWCEAEGVKPRRKRVARYAAIRAATAHARLRPVAITTTQAQ